MEFANSPARSGVGASPAGVPIASSGSVEPMELYTGEEDDWTSDVYARLNGSTGTRNIVPAIPCAEKWTCTRVATALFSLLLLLSGLCVFGVACAALAQRLTHRVHIPFCRSCSTIATLGLLIGAVVAVVGALGLRAMLRRRRLSCSSVVFAVCLAAVAVFAGSGIVYVAYTQHKGTSRARVQELWEGVVRRHSSLACDLEATLQCSGLSGRRCCLSAPLHSPASEPRACFLVEENGTVTHYVSPTTMAAITWPETICPKGCPNVTKTFDVGCDDVLVAVLFSSYQRLLASLALVATLSTIFAVFAFLRLREKPERQRVPPAYIQFEY